MQYIFLSHDVDWRKQGPGPEHILARKERFDPQLFEKTSIEKMYYNFPEFMEIKRNLGLNRHSFSEQYMKMVMFLIMKMKLIH